MKNNDKLHKEIQRIKDVVLQGEFSNEPLIFIYVQTYDEDDDYQEIVDTDQYMKEYCSTLNGQVNIFSGDFRFRYNPLDESVTVYPIFHFNTREYGVEAAYAEDQLHESDEYGLYITKSSFNYMNDEIRWETEEEKFQLSCTDLGFFIDACDTIYKAVLDDISQHGGE